jgi:hypothetical protein
LRRTAWAPMLAIMSAPTAATPNTSGRDASALGNHCDPIAETTGPFVASTIAFALLLLVVTLTLGLPAGLVATVVMIAAVLVHAIRSKRWLSVPAVCVAATFVLVAGATFAVGHEDSCSMLNWGGERHGASLVQEGGWSWPHLAFTCVGTYPDGTTRTDFVK